MKCINHPEIDAKGKCISCGSDICEGCIVESKNESYCKKCISQKIESNPNMEPQRSPALAAILSFIIAGCGQLYNGQLGKGLTILFTSWLVIPWVYGIFDAYKTATKINEGSLVPKYSISKAFTIAAIVFVGVMVLFSILGIVAAILIPQFVNR